MVFSSLTPRDPEEVFEQLFHILAQPKTRHQKPQQLGSEVSEQENPSSNGESNEATERETGALRTGFREFLSYIVALKPQIEAVRSRPDEDITQVIQAKSPAEFQAFQRAAIQNVHHRRLCITQGERIIMAPKRAQVSDKIILFEECDIPFVLRPVDHVSRDVDARAETLNGKSIYRLIGPAFLYLPENEAKSSKEDIQEIRIV